MDFVSGCLENFSTIMPSFSFGIYSNDSGNIINKAKRVKTFYANNNGSMAELK